MNGTAKKILMVLMVTIMLLGTVPAVVCSQGSDSHEGGRTRGTEVTVNNVTVQAHPDFIVNGVYGNGMYGVGVNFTLTQKMMNVNVTINITKDQDEMTNNTELGNRSAGNYDTMETGLALFNFANPGMYTINATVEGWLNGTGMINGTGEMAPQNFTTIINYEFNLTVEGNKYQEKYGKDMLTISTGVINAGNAIVQSTNVSVEIKNISSDEVEQTIYPEDWEMLDHIWPSDESDRIMFFWLPSEEGTDSQYEINITATNVSLGKSNFTTQEVHVMNVSDVHLMDFQYQPPLVYQMSIFDVIVTLNNTGNAVDKGSVRLLIYPDGTPGTILHDETVLSEDVAPSQGTSGRQNPGEARFTNVTVKDPGEYDIEVRLLGTADTITKDLTVIELPNIPPSLKNHTVSETSPVTAGTEVTFSVTYADYDHHTGNVTLLIHDGETETSHDMVAASDNWIGDVIFTYAWKPAAGNYTYYFHAEDWPGAETTLQDAVNFTFDVSAPTQGWLYVEVTDQDGNVSGVDIVIYNTTENATGATVVDTYFDTTEVDGNYSSFLPFSDCEYVVKINNTWLDDNDYKRVDNNIRKVLIDIDHLIVHQDYTLEKIGVGVKKTMLNGTVNDTAGNLSNVTITVEMFVDVPGEMNVTVEDSNDTVAVNVTTRYWMNLTIKTDENGSFSIVDIPHLKPLIGDVTDETDNTTYRADLNQTPVPLEATEGYWRVFAGKDGYIKDEKLLKFEEGKTTWWNLTLVEEKVVVFGNYTITGKVTPADATLTFSGGHKAVVVPATGNFTIEKVPDGDYKLRFSKDGYYDEWRNFTVNGANKTLGNITLIEKHPDLDPTYTITIGPFIDGDKDPIPNINISFTYDGEDYWALTRSNGIAYFENFPVATLSNATDITVFYDNKTVEGPLGEIDFEVFADKKEEEDDPMDIYIIIAIVVIVFIIIILVVLAMKSKGVSEDELFDDELREYECPSCGAVVNSDMEECPECGETFEEEEFKCPECGEPVEMDATECEGCGAEFEAPEKALEDELPGEEDDELPEPPEGPEVFSGDDIAVESDVPDPELEGVEELADELENEEL